MEYTIHLDKLKELVEFCNGDKDKIFEWLDAERVKEPTTIEELKVYPFKEHFRWVVSEKDAPKLRAWIDDWECNKGELMTLDTLLERLEEWEVDGRTARAIKRELVKLKFGSMEYDW